MPGRDDMVRVHETGLFKRGETTLALTVSAGAVRALDLSPDDEVEIWMRPGADRFEVRLTGRKRPKPQARYPRAG